MSNPQQPELARSRKPPHQDQDAVAAVVQSQPQPGRSGPDGPVPPENQAGHHPPQEQDKPDLDAFAARLGVPDEAGHVPTPPDAQFEDKAVLPAVARTKTMVMVGAGVAALVAALLAIKLFRRRSRNR